jgi:hypothetical protein
MVALVEETLLGEFGGLCNLEPDNTLERRRQMHHRQYLYITYLFILLSLIAIIFSGSWLSPMSLGLKSVQAAETTCHPTPAAGLGPFYEPNAPVRSSVGKGHILTGVVKSSLDCSPIAGARIEFWLANTKGRYDDDHRATVFSDESGKYRFESNFPPGYSGRPSHIHMRVSARGYRTLVTQHYPVKGREEGAFNLVIIPTR